MKGSCRPLVVESSSVVRPSLLAVMLGAVLCVTCFLNQFIFDLIENYWLLAFCHDCWFVGGITETRCGWLINPYLFCSRVFSISNAFVYQH